MFIKHIIIILTIFLTCSNHTDSGKNHRPHHVTEKNSIDQIVPSSADLKTSTAEGIINVATCQFPVIGDIKENGLHIRRQTQAARKAGADVAHFPEYALCGYPGKDFDSWDDFDWNLLKSESEAICQLAAEQKIWIIFGSAHRLSDDHLPHNCLYVIDDRGRIVDRYDKRFCSFRELDKFSPGDHFSVFTINGVRCGLLICADSRYPELYREYKKLRVDCIFHSFHIARSPGPNILTTVIPATIQTRAATNYLWISAPNSVAYYQTFPSIFVQPDGALVDSLKRNVTGIMMNEVNIHKKLYDSTAPFRDRAMSGILHSGTLVQDPRSANRKEF